MKKILVLTLILNLGFCSGLPSNANANANVECYQLRTSFSNAQGVTTISESFECPEGLEIKTDSNTGNISIVSNGTGNVGTINGGTVNHWNPAVTPNVKTTGTPAQAKK